ncbi:hypothetical protein SAMN02910384_02900 [Pseudobutyrivibrio sp. ACV-2]|uniref:helix-turn-helix domain-containing protein n=1 Tax=Pseudobutyrivibrio sp. ACV-2 TaxID=1520801 RepID=UPI00089B97CB|nr:helix-turn-helix transcriptional regulator [Pseudobutyrivibrio sp. ACV-2]SEA97179.1 hypothetical protein SAMN02910384_02900 [Pseudobutyrivibrio sp. ACV-2]
MDLTNELSRNLKELLEYSNMSRSELAAWLEVNDTTLKNYIYGDRDNPDLNLLYHIARKLYVYPFDLMYRTAFWRKSCRENYPIECEELTSLLHNTKVFEESFGNSLFDYEETPQLLNNVNKIITRCKQIGCGDFVISKLKGVNNLSAILNNKVKPSTKTACQIAYHITGIMKEYPGLQQSILIMKFEDDAIDTICQRINVYSKISFTSKITKMIPYLILNAEESRNYDSNILELIKMIDCYIQKPTKNYSELIECLKSLLLLDEDAFDYYAYLIFELVKHDYLSYVPFDFYTEFRFDKQLLITSDKLPTEKNSPFYQKAIIVSRYARLDDYTNYELQLRYPFTFTPLCQNSTEYLITKESIHRIAESLNIIKNRMNQSDTMIFNTEYQRIMSILTEQENEPLGYWTDKKKDE